MGPRYAWLRRGMLELRSKQLNTSVACPKDPHGSCGSCGKLRQSYAKTWTSYAGIELYV